MAERYDELRGKEEQLAEQFEFTVAAGPRRGHAAARRRLRHGSARRGRGRAPGRAGWGVDASEPMLAKARERRVRGAAFRLAQADALPFRKGWFDAVTMRLVVHTLGERRALR